MIFTGSKTDPYVSPEHGSQLWPSEMSATWLRSARVCIELR